MNHGNFNGSDDWTPYLMQQFPDSFLISPVAEQEFVQDQHHLVGTTTNYNNIAAAGSEVMLPDVTTKQTLQHEVISTQIANDETMKETSAVDPAANYKLEKKRKSDREYRQRCKEMKKKTEEELKVLRKENALLHGRLQTADSKQMLEKEQNDSDQLCKMEFRLDCYNVKLRGEAMRIVGEFPGLKWFSMDVEEKKLTLYGKNNIDTLPLQNKLRKMCNASLLSFSIVTKKDEEKKEGRIVMDMVVARSSTLQLAQNSNGGSSEGCIRINEAAFISFTSLAPARCCGLF